MQGARKKPGPNSEGAGQEINEMSWRLYEGRKQWRKEDQVSKRHREAIGYKEKKVQGARASRKKEAERRRKGRSKE